MVTHPPSSSRGPRHCPQSAQRHSAAPGDPCDEAGAGEGSSANRGIVNHRPRHRVDNRVGRHHPSPPRCAPPPSLGAAKSARAQQNPKPGARRGNQPLGGLIASRRRHSARAQQRHRSIRSSSARRMAPAPTTWQQGDVERMPAARRARSIRPRALALAKPRGDIALTRCHLRLDLAARSRSRTAPRALVAMHCAATDHLGVKVSCDRRQQQRAHRLPSLSSSHARSAPVGGTFRAARRPLPSDVAQEICSSATRAGSVRRSTSTELPACGTLPRV